MRLPEGTSRHRRPRPGTDTRRPGRPDPAPPARRRGAPVGDQVGDQHQPQEQEHPDPLGRAGRGPAVAVTRAGSGRHRDSSRPKQTPCATSSQPIRGLRDRSSTTIRPSTTGIAAAEPRRRRSTAGKCGAARPARGSVPGNCSRPVGTRIVRPGRRAGDGLGRRRGRRCPDREGAGRCRSPRSRGSCRGAASVRRPWLDRPGLRSRMYTEDVPGAATTAGHPRPPRPQLRTPWRAWS